MTIMNSSLQTRLYMPRRSMAQTQTLAGLITALLDDPNAWALAIKYLPNPASVPVGPLAGLVVGGLLAHLGIQQPPDAVMGAFCAGGAVLGHYVWVWLSNRFKPTLPADPTTGIPK